MAGRGCGQTDVVKAEAAWDTKTGRENKKVVSSGPLSSGGTDSHENGQEGLLMGEREREREGSSCRDVLGDCFVTFLRYHVLPDGFLPLRDVPAAHALGQRERFAA